MVNKWEQYEKDFLREVSGVMSRADIAEKLERSQASIATQASKMGVALGVIRTNRPWMTSEILLFESNTDHEIKRITGRTLQSIQSKRYELSGRRVRGL